MVDELLRLVRLFMLLPHIAGEKSHGATSMLYSHASAALSWDGFHLAEVLLTQPLMVVVGDKVGAFGVRDKGRNTASACAIIAICQQDVWPRTAGRVPTLRS
jgi:hypothetical protein